MGLTVSATEVWALVAPDLDTPQLRYVLGVFMSEQDALDWAKEQGFASAEFIKYFGGHRVMQPKVEKTFLWEHYGR